MLESNQHLSNGTRGENRTHDALIKSQVLYRLSYADERQGTLIPANRATNKRLTRSQLLLRKRMLFKHKSFSFAKSHLTTVRTWKTRQRAVLNYTVNLRKVAVCVFNNAMLKGVYLIALAGTDGLEPSLRESKSRALPLRYVPIKPLAVHQTPFNHSCYLTAPSTRGVIFLIS